MLMIIEIVLTIRAWRNGWGWKALIPVAIFFGLAFFAGLIIATSGETVADKGIFVIGDILFVITQAVLASKTPKQAGIHKTAEILAYE